MVAPVQVEVANRRSHSQALVVVAVCRPSWVRQLLVQMVDPCLVACGPVASAREACVLEACAPVAYARQEACAQEACVLEACAQEASALVASARVATAQAPYGLEACALAAFAQVAQKASHSS